MTNDGSDLRDAMGRQLDGLQPRTPIEHIRHRAHRGRLFMAASLVALIGLAGASGTFMLNRFAGDDVDRVVGPAPSPDQGLVAFTTQDQSEPMPWVAVVPASGGEVTRLREGSDPSWSPDGTRIAFRCYPGICTMNADGSDLDQITDPPDGATDEDPDWGPDHRILFTRTYSEVGRGRDIFVTPFPGKAEQRIGHADPDDSQPSWSPDGMHIAFIRGLGEGLEAPTGGFQLFIANDDGGQIRQLTTKGASRPDWAPDGQTILFDEASALWTIPVGGGEPMKLSTVSGRSFDVGSFASWAPDSRRFAFMCSSTGADNNDICLSDVDAEGWTALIATDENEASPAWQPRTPHQEIDQPGPTETHAGYVVGSEEVVMAFGSEGDIWLALSDGSVVNVTQSPETESSPTISFDDKVLVYERLDKFGGGTLVYHRLATGESAEFAEGRSPAFGPLDYLAWDSGRGQVVVGSPFSDWTVRAPNGPGGEGATSFSFAWDQSLELLYYEVAFGHSVNPYYIDIVRVDGWECSECGGGLELGRVRSLQPDDGTEGEFLSTSFGTSVDVLRVCCRESDTDAGETAEIGGLDPFDTGTLYNRLRGLDNLPLDLGVYLGLAHAGSLDANVRGDEVEWETTDRNAWFVINQMDLWLVTDGGTSVRLPFKVSGGVAVAPTFARSPLIHNF